MTAPEHPGTCRDCGTAINAGEAKAFGVCDACWAKAYPEAEHPTVPTSLHPSVPVDEGGWPCREVPPRSLMQRAIETREDLAAAATEHARDFFGSDPSKWTPDNWERVIVGALDRLNREHFPEVAALQGLQRDLDATRRELAEAREELKSQVAGWEILYRRDSDAHVDTLRELTSVRRERDAFRKLLAEEVRTSFCQESPSENADVAASFCIDLTDPNGVATCWPCRARRALATPPEPQR